MHQADNVDAKRMLFNEQSPRMVTTRAVFSGLVQRAETRGVVSSNGMMNRVILRSL